MRDIASCDNVKCDFADQCFRSKLFRERAQETYIFSAFFARSAGAAQARGFDCFWPLEEKAHG